MRRRAIFAALVFGVVAACTSAPSAVPPAVAFHAGTRLHPKTLVGGELHVFDGVLHDTKLDVDCRFMTLTDERLHCAPVALYAEPHYDDAQCTVPIVEQIDDTCATSAPRYAFGPSATSGECGRSDVLELGAMAPRTTVYRKDVSGCVAVQTTRPFAAVKRVVPPSELVSGTISREARGAELQMAFVDGDDGSRIELRAEKVGDHRGACAVRATGDGVMRCVPMNVGYLGYYYADGACSTPLAAYYGNEDSCTATPVALEARGPQATCAASRSGTTDFFEVGAPVTGSVFENAPTCGAYTPATQERMYDRGAPIAPTVFPRVTLGTAPASFGPRWWTTDGGEHVGTHLAWDGVHDTECAPARGEDGVTRCLPSPSELDVVFTDAACTAAVLAFHGDPECPTRAPARFARSSKPSNDVCVQPTATVYAVGNAVAEPPQRFRWQPNGTCGIESGSAKTYFALTRIPPAELVALTPTTE